MARRGTEEPQGMGCVAGDGGGGAPECATARDGGAAGDGGSATERGRRRAARRTSVEGREWRDLIFLSLDGRTSEREHYRFSPTLQR
jgi:hypothetical protein